MKEQNTELDRLNSIEIQSTVTDIPARPTKPIPSDTFDIRIFDTSTAPAHFALNKIDNKEFYLAMENSMHGFELRYMEVYVNETRVSTIPYFFTHFDLSTMIEQPIAKYFLKFLKLPVNIVGNPCLPYARIEGLLNQKIIDEVAKHLLKKNSLMAMKGVQINTKVLGFAHARSLPTTRLNMDPDIFTKIKKNRSIARKMRDSEALQFIEVRNPSFEQLTRIYEMYEATYEKAPVKFGKLDFSYFQKSAQNCIFSIAALGDKWVGFTQLFVRKDEMIAHFAGLDYSIDKKHGVYFALYFQILKIAQNLNVKTIDFGETTYEWKKRLGCELHETSIYFKHKNSLMNWFLEQLKFLLEPGAEELK